MFICGHIRISCRLGRHRVQSVHEHGLVFFAREHCHLAFLPCQANPGLNRHGELQCPLRTVTATRTHYCADTAAAMARKGVIDGWDARASNVPK